MDMNLKLVVLATFSPLGFDAFIDQVELLVE
jgi:hypothetical protein